MFNQKSILEMARGAFMERVNYEIPGIIANITDPNTRPDKKRSLVVTLDFLPDANRENIRVLCTVKPKLEATSPVTTSLYITADENGEMVAVEMVPQTPGQLDLMGGEQENPAVLKLTKIG